jgi:hypothetical protein
MCDHAGWKMARIYYKMHQGERVQLTGTNRETSFSEKAMISSQPYHRSTTLDSASHKRIKRRESEVMPRQPS